MNKQIHVSKHCSALLPITLHATSVCTAVDIAIPSTPRMSALKTEDVNTHNDAEEIDIFLKPRLYAHLHPGANLLPVAKLHPGVNLHLLMKRSYVNKLCSYVIGFAL